ncbi:MAG: hypothetical protein J3K34DRAFT_251816 [Monoraphidium minutum]|nr:MAG: hypothetical protein J3K34DRAFT_251816 [Monoraphidium minutum]
MSASRRKEVARRPAPAQVGCGSSGAAAAPQLRRAGDQEGLKPQTRMAQATRCDCGCKGRVEGESQAARAPDCQAKCLLGNVRGKGKGVGMSVGMGTSGCATHSFKMKAQSGGPTIMGMRGASRETAPKILESQQTASRGAQPPARGAPRPAQELSARGQQVAAPHIACASAAASSIRRVGAAKGLATPGTAAAATACFAGGGLGLGAGAPFCAVALGAGAAAAAALGAGDAAVGALPPATPAAGGTAALGARGASGGDAGRGEGASERVRASSNWMRALAS